MHGVTVDPADILACYPEVSVELRLGNGSFKQVFKVKDASGAEFVIKVVQLDVLDQGQPVRLSAIEERLTLEIALMQQVESPFLPALGPLEARDFTKQRLVFRAFSEEYIGEKSVEDLLAENHFDYTQLHKLLRDLASALAVYNNYEQGFVHRDIKPSNIIYRYSDDVYVLIDPGVHLTPSNPTITPSPHHPQGTPAYFSPEQALRVRRHLDFRSDMFSIGIVAYQIIKGSHPFQPLTNPNWIDDLINARYEQLLVVDFPNYEKIIPIVHKLLGRYPHTRYNSPEALLLRLEEVK